MSALIFAATKNYLSNFVLKNPPHFHPPHLVEAAVASGEFHLLYSAVFEASETAPNVASQYQVASQAFQEH